jgi:hypothetical protein
MADRSHRAVLVIAAGACLALCACGGSPTSSATPAGPPKQVKHFCAEVTAALTDTPATPPGKKISPAAARRELARILRAKASGFASLEAKSPPQVRASVKTMARVYQDEEKLVAQPGSISGISKALVKQAGMGEGGAALHQVLAYMRTNCR